MRTHVKLVIGQFLLLLGTVLVGLILQAPVRCDADNRPTLLIRYVLNEAAAEEKAGRVDQATTLLYDHWILLDESLEESERPQDAAVLVHALAAGFQEWASASERSKRYADALSEYEQASAFAASEGDIAKECDNLDAAGTVDEEMSRYQDALVCLNRSLLLARRLREVRQAETCLANIGVVYEDMSRYGLALQADQQSLTMAQQTGDRQDQETVTANIGAVYEYEGRYDDALDEMQSSMTIAASLDDQNVVENDVSNMGLVYEDLGKYKDALREFGLALALSAKTANSRLQEQIYSNIGGVYEAEAQYEKALDEMRKSLQLSTQYGDRSSEMTNHANIGIVDTDLGRLDEALSEMKQALALAKSTDDLNGQESVLESIGGVYQTKGRCVQALNVETRALHIATQIGDLSGEAHGYGAIGSAWNSLGQYGRALDCFTKSVELAARIRDVRTEEQVLGNMGTVYRELGRYEDALDSMKRSRTLANEIGDTSMVEADDGNIGTVYEQLGEFDQCIEEMNLSLAIATRIGDIEAEATDIGNIGVAYRDLGQYENARIQFHQSLALSAKIGDVAQEVHAIGNIGTVDMFEGHFAASLAQLNRGLALADTIGDQDSIATLFGYIGEVYERAGRNGSAQEATKKSLAMATSIGDINQEEVDFRVLGLIDDHCGRRTAAIADYRTAIMLQRQIHDTETEGLTLSNLMNVEKELGKPALAAFYGKEAVAAFQDIRSGVAHVETVDPGAQKSFLANVQSAYRQLADILIDMGRLPEAEQIMGLLKDQEARDYVQRDAMAALPASGSLSWQAGERAAGRQEQALEAPILAIGAQIDALKRITPRPAAQIVALEAKLRPAENAYNEFLTTTLPAELPNPTDDTRERVADALGAEGPFMKTLHDLGPGTVALYTLVEPDKYRVIVITSQAQAAAEYMIPSSDLRHLVLQWRAALCDPSIDPRPLGEKLYKILVGPIAADLTAAHAKVLMWSLDDVLRYVPMAALYDGKRYLVERYQNTVFTHKDQEGGLNAGTNGSDAKWTVLGVGVSRGSEVDGLQFPALAGVPKELAGVVREPGGSGVLPGTIRLDDQFTEQQFEIDLASGYQVVHVASHFNVGIDDRSTFLLLGSGPLRMSDLMDKAQIFQDVDLLTLSACQTAVGVPGGDGHELESFASIAERKGAASIIASLWPVDDESTQELMDEFYRLHETKGSAGNSKSQALQKAQLALINGTETITPGAMRGTINTQGSDSGGRGEQLPPFVSDPHRPYAHPYYWAPFILIGNWK